MAGKFRFQSRWDPALILTQIFTIQFLSYSSLGLLIFIATTLSGYSPSTIFIFNHKVRQKMFDSFETVVQVVLTFHFTHNYLLHNLPDDAIGNCKNSYTSSHTKFCNWCVSPEDFC